MAFASLQTITNYADKHVDTASKLNQQYTAGQWYVINGGTGISLFTHSGDWRGVVHQNRLILRAQSRDIALNAKTGLVATTIESAIMLTDKTSITFVSDKAGIRIADGCVGIFGPTRMHLHTADFDALGPQGIDGALPQFDSGDTGRKLRLIRPADNEPVTNRLYEIVKRDGSVIRGISNALGEAELHESQATDVLAIKFG